jgi:hypothetical protein
MYEDAAFIKIDMNILKLLIKLKYNDEVYIATCKLN